MHSDTRSSSECNRYIAVQGNPYEIGFQHGAAFRDEIRAFTKDNFARINLLRAEPMTEESLYRELNYYLDQFNRHLPSVSEELAGLAEGAGIELPLACLLQVRRELIGYRKVPTFGDCSTLASTVHQPYLAQTIDLNGDMGPLATVIHIRNKKNACPDILMFTFKGLLGYLGMNSAGLCIGINLVLSGDWGAGIPPYLTVRRLLECSSVDQCISIIQKLPHASSRSFTLLDKEKLVVVEFTPTSIKTVEKEMSTHTNHFLDASLSRLDEINILARNSSLKRLQLLDDFSRTYKYTANPDSIFKMLASHSLYPDGLCVHNNRNILREETVGAVVMLPREGCLQVRFGAPCNSSTQIFSL